MNIKLKKWSKPIIFMIACLSCIQGYWVANLQFDYNFEALFPSNDTELAFFQEFRKTFADENEYLSVGFYHEKGIFQEDFLKKLDSCTQQLHGIEEVLHVTSPTTMKFLSFNLWGRKKESPILHLNSPALYQKDSSYIYQQSDLLHNFFSETRKATCVYLQIKNGLVNTDTGQLLLDRIHSTIQEFEFDEYHVLGTLQSQQANTQKVKNEFYLFTALSSILVVAFLFFVFRSLWGIIVPLVVIGLCSLWTMGIMGGLGIPVNLMTMMIPTIIFVVAMSDVIHLLSKYLDELRLGKTQADALSTTIKEVGLATLLTSITTSLGFLTLLSAGVKPFVQFGLFAAIGVMLSFLITFSLLPSLLILLPRPQMSHTQANDHFWNRLLQHIFLGLFKQRLKITFAAIGLLIIAAIGIQKLEIEAYFTDEIDRNDPLSQDIQFFEQQFGGIRPVEISIHLKDSTSSLWEAEAIQELNKLEQYLRTDYQIHKPYSIIGILKAANRSLMGGQSHYYRLPSSKKRLQKLIDRVKEFSDPQRLKNVISTNQLQARIAGSIHDIGSIAVAKRNEQLQQFINKNIDTSKLAIRITGSATLVDRSHQMMSINMLQGLGIALVVVALFMGFLYRNPKAVLVALIPNMFPLLMIAGLIGSLGIGLKMSTSIIFTIAFGIAVDDTIHFMTKLNLELKKGLPLFIALKRTVISTGKAIILTSIILSSGFFVMMLSDFNGTFYMGVFVGLTLVFAVLADILLIPLLVIVLKLGKRN